MPVELRSIYSGPIRRSLERLERQIAEMTPVVAALNARIEQLETRTTNLEGGSDGN